MRPAILRAALLALIVIIAGTAGARAEDISEKRMISVSGVGSVKAKPDTARISIGVVSDDNTAREALDKNTAAMSRVIVELKGQQVDPKDIQTTNFSVNPRYQHFKDGKPPAIIGYRVVNSVTIIVRELDNLGKILDQTVSRGSNQVNSIRFDIDNADELEIEARKRAIKDARQKAQVYAQAAGVKLGTVLTISEGASSHPRPVMRPRTLEAGAASVPIETGEQEVTARVQVSWKLTD